MSISSEISRISGEVSTQADLIEQISAVLETKAGGGDIDVSPLSVTENGVYTAPTGQAYSPVTVDVEVEDPITVSPLSVTENGVYTAPTGEAYSPVTVNVQGEDPVTVTPLSVTENGTYTAPTGTAYSPVTVDVPEPTPTPPTLETISVTPSESAQQITPSQGYDGIGEVDVSAIPSSYVGTGVDRRSSSDLTVSGATVTAPSGYYSASASKSVVSGTAGTPTTTKGSVTNHRVTVSSSVTNSTGYINGGTINGNSVTVAAEDLVSGSETKTANGTYDVTNLSTLVVQIPVWDGSVS